jgi:hypothetical protein
MRIWNNRNAQAEYLNMYTITEAETKVGQPNVELLQVESGVPNIAYPEVECKKSFCVRSS